MAQYNDAKLIADLRDAGLIPPRCKSWSLSFEPAADGSHHYIGTISTVCYVSDSHKDLATVLKKYRLVLIEENPEEPHVDERTAGILQPKGDASADAAGS